MSTKGSRKEVKKKDKRRTAAEVSRWENATVEWLSDPKYFQANYLPRMKVPGDRKSQGVYPDKTDYFDTICRLWIGLTFEDGNKALSPKCRERQQGSTKECGTVRIVIFIHDMHRCLVKSSKDPAVDWL